MFRVRGIIGNHWNGDFFHIWANAAVNMVATIMLVVLLHMGAESINVTERISRMDIPNHGFKIGQFSSTRVGGLNLILSPTRTYSNEIDTKMKGR